MTTSKQHITGILKKGAVHKTGLIWIVWTAWEIFQVLRWSWKVCIKTWQVWFWLQDDKVLSQSDELHSRSWDHIKWIWQSLASYLTIKSDKKSSQQQAHELYPFLPSCSLSLSLSLSLPTQILSTFSFQSSNWPTSLPAQLFWLAVAKQ